MAGSSAGIELIDLTDAVEARPRPRKRLRDAKKPALIDLTGGQASPYRTRRAAAVRSSAAQENVAQPAQAIDLTDSRAIRAGLRRGSPPVKRPNDEARQAQWEAPTRRRRTQHEQLLPRRTAQLEEEVDQPAKAGLALQAEQQGHPQQQQQQQEAGGPCSICFEDEGPLMHSFVACGHRLCLPCLREYVAGKVEDRVFPVPCPLPDCKAPISAAECGLVLTPDEQATLGKMEAEAAVGEGARLFCPNPRCSQLLIADDKRADTPLDCPYCAQRVCAQCGVAWHKGLTCKQYQAKPGAVRSKEDQALLDLAEKDGLRRCPGCGQMVERTQGCSHMTCRCGTVFCFSCGRSKQRHSSHYCNCKPHAEQWMNPPPVLAQQLQAQQAQMEQQLQAQQAQLAQQMEQARVAAARLVAERRAAARAAQRAARQQQQQTRQLHRQQQQQQTRQSPRQQEQQQHRSPRQKQQEQQQQQQQSPRQKQQVQQHVHRPYREHPGQVAPAVLPVVGGGALMAGMPGGGGAPMAGVPGPGLAQVAFVGQRMWQRFMQ